MAREVGVRRRNAVFGILLTPNDEVLVVANRRSSGGVRWSFPGGLVDREETSLEALKREVEEDPSLITPEWPHHVYTTLVQFREGRRDLDLNVEIYLSKNWEGELDFSSDPDGLVVDGIFANISSIGDFFYDSDDYISEPIMEWMFHRWEDPVHFTYLVEGKRPERTIRRTRYEKLT